MDTKGKNQQGILSFHRYNNLDKRVIQPCWWLVLHTKMWIVKEKSSKKEKGNSNNTTSLIT
jgi:hypothetical protein